MVLPHASTAGGTGSIPDQEAKIPLAVGQKKKRKKERRRRSGGRGPMGS